MYSSKTNSPTLNTNDSVMTGVSKTNSLNTTLTRVHQGDAQLQQMLAHGHNFYNIGQYTSALDICEKIYELDAYRTDNLLLLGAIHFQLRNFSECVFYNQQCIRVDPSFAEAYSNLGNALKELGDIKAAIQFYLKAVKLKPRFCDAYNNLASAYMQLGQIQEAMETYQMALVLNPNLVDAHSNLGNLYKAQGNTDAAKKCYLESIRIRPDFAIAWSNLAGIFKDEGELPTAVAYYKEAIRLCPGFADAHSNLGNAFKESHLLEEAMSAYRTAIKLRPDFAIAHGNLASCHYDMGQFEEAVGMFRYAIQLEPNFPDAYNNLGNALREVNQLDEAVKCYRAALRLKPDHPHAYNNLGNAMKDKGLIKEAIHCYVTSIRLLPKFAAAHSNLGSVLKEQGKINQALSHFHEAITIDPMFADAYSNMGNAYKDLGRFDEAIKCYTTAIRIRPSFADAYSNLASAHKDAGQAVLAIQYYRQALELRPDFPDAFANLVHTLVLICDWSTRDADFAQLSSHVQRQLSTTGSQSIDAGGKAHTGRQGSALYSGVGVSTVLPSVQPFHALVYPLSMKEMLQISQRYAARARMNVALTDIKFQHPHRASGRASKMRIGYVSSDLGNHPLSHLMQSVFGLHDRSRFEVTCYALSPSDYSEWRLKIERGCDRFVDLSAFHNVDAAQLIYNDGIQILVNLNGYTKGARNEIFALQPAPIQISYLGFCGTMGADYIQYVVADSVVVPKDKREYYQEKVIEMPHSYFVNDHRNSARYIFEKEKLPKRSDYGISDDKFVYCNFNQLYKLDPRTFDTWMNILKRVPNAVLWLLRFPPAAETNIIAEARKRGVRDEQLFFSDVAPKQEHISRGHLGDLFLDTPCCNAHTTACDILWSGTPVLTLPEEKMASRVAASLLLATGLTDFVVSSLTEYEDLAVTLAMDPEKLFQARRKLENQRLHTPIFDTARWVRNFEKGLTAVWQRWEASSDPDHITVLDDDPVVDDPQPQILLA